MKKSPVKPPRDAVAVLVGRGRIAVVGGPFGDRAQSLHGAHDRFAANELIGLLEEVFEENPPKGPVILGASPSVDYLATRRRDALPGQTAHPSLVDELEERYGRKLVIQELEGHRLATTHQTVIAAPRRAMREAAEAIHANGRGKLRIVSTTHALVRLAESLDSRPNGWESDIRVFPGKRQALAVFSCAGVPLSRQVLPLVSGGDEGMAAALHSMFASVQESLKLDPPNGVLIHAGNDRTGLLEACRRATGVEVKEASLLGFDKATLCHALACEAGRRRPAPEENIFRALAEAVGAGPRARLPIAGLAGVGLVLASVAGVLHETAQSLEGELSALDVRTRDALDQYGRDPIELSETLDELRRNAVIAQSFLMDRVYWSDFMEAVPELLPGEVLLDRLEGVHPLHIPKDDEETASRMPDAYLEFTCRVPVRDGALRIPQVPQLTSALRGSELFRENFSFLPNAAVNVRPNAADQVARLTVRCSRRKP